LATFHQLYTHRTRGTLRRLCGPIGTLGMLNILNKGLEWQYQLQT